MPANGNIVDANGTAIVVGSKVKIDATVIAINPFHEHFAELEITFTYPGQAPLLHYPSIVGVQDGTQTPNPGQFKGVIYPRVTKINAAMVLVGT